MMKHKVKLTFMLIVEVFLLPMMLDARLRPDMVDDVDTVSKEEDNIPNHLEDANFPALIRLRERDVKRACPNGTEYCICANNPKVITYGPFSYEESRFGAFYTYWVCSPGTCFCKDDPDTPKDARNWPLKAVMDTCPPGEMNRCLCHDDSTVTFPFRTGTLGIIVHWDASEGGGDNPFLAHCRPKRCKCNGSNRVHKVTKMGCKNGGFPKCPRSNNNVCKDGTNVNRKLFIENKLAGSERCICADGVMPKCKDTNDYIKCPDGSYVDWSIGGPQDFVHCRLE